MKKIRSILPLVLFSLFIMNTYSQEIEEQQKNEAFLKGVFSKLAPKDFVNLVPYQDSTGKWGYLDKYSKNRMVNPFLDEPLFFKPGIEGIYNGNNFSVDQNGTLHFTYRYTKEEEESLDVIEMANRDYDEKVRTSAKGFKGFTVDAKGNLLTYSDLYQYNTQGFPAWNISIFQWKDKYYGVVRNKITKKSGIIDTDGNPLEGFDFNYDDILYCRYEIADKKNIWFYYKNNGNKYYSLVSTGNKKKFINEIIDYPCLSSKLLSYVVFSNNELYSVFDHYNLKWIIKPQKKYKINYQIYYSSSKPIDVEKIEERKNACIYFLITESNRNYFVDVNLNKYVPLK